MGDVLMMSKKERLRKTLLDQFASGHLTRQDTRQRLQVSERHFKRILRRYRQAGDAGIVHRNRGKRSGRALSGAFKEAVLDRYRERYLGFGPTFASEKLAEDGLAVKAETLRLWLKGAGLWTGSRKARRHRRRRARRERYGELLQLDGSLHAWLPGSEQKQCLMNLVDDATGKSLALMAEGETTRSALELLSWWVKDAGIPMAIYVDLKSLYVSPKSLSSDDASSVESGWLTHFSRACQKLGIEVLKAHSPQAKGRVERKHAVYQDRWVKELALGQIKTIAGAHAFLDGGFINRLNEKFATPAQDPRDAHIPWVAGDDWSPIVCWEYAGQVKNDGTLQYHHQHYQLLGDSLKSVRPKQKVRVREHLDGRVSLWLKEQALAFERIECPSRAQWAPEQGQRVGREQTRGRRPNAHKHPWSRFNPHWLNPRKGAVV